MSPPAKWLAFRPHNFSGDNANKMQVFTNNCLVRMLNISRKEMTNYVEHHDDQPGTSQQCWTCWNGSNCQASLTKVGSSGLSRHGTTAEHVEEDTGEGMERMEPQDRVLGLGTVGGLCSSRSQMEKRRRRTPTNNWHHTLAGMCGIL